MKVSALIFAGGTGSRMKSGTKPKQFLELYGKPIIIHTIEKFENHPNVDEIVIVCIESWLDYLKKLIIKFKLKKVTKIVAGGTTGQLSIYNGLTSISREDENIVLIHDGVRPLIEEEVISKNIEIVIQKGNAITTKPVIETVIQIDENNEITNVIDRHSCMTAVAPQSFYLEDILNYHKLALQDGIQDSIDSASLARHYGANLHTVLGGPENIKITTPSDYYIFKAIYDAKVNEQVFG